MLQGVGRFSVSKEGVSEIHVVPGSLRCCFDREPELRDRLGRALAAQ